MSVPDPRQAEKTPTPTSVYRYYDRHGLLLYVGITQRGARRNGEHNRDKDWWPYVVRQDVQHYPSRDDAEREEKRLIRQYRPPFNRQHNPDHESVKAAYYAIAQMNPRTLRDWIAKAHKRVPLILVEQTKRVARMRTAPGYEMIAAHIDNEASIGGRLGLPGGHTGRVTGVEILGGAAVINIRRDGGIYPVSHGFASLKVYRQQQPIALRVSGGELKGHA